MADLSNIGEAAVGGGVATGFGLWLAKLFVKSKLDQLEKNTADIIQIKQQMVTRADLDSTSENLQESITQSRDSITARIDQLMMRLNHK